MSSQPTSQSLPELHESVCDRQVAQFALDVVLGQMHSVYERGIPVLLESLRLVVAAVATGLIRSPVTRCHLFMTGNAGHHVAHVLRVIHDDP